MLSLPDFPWDTLAAAKARASAHPDGLIDLSVGTPVDPTPPLIRAALAEAADAHGYPQTWGTPDLREAVAIWYARRRGVPDVDPAGVMPTIGSKELVAWLPTLLGLGPGDAVAIPAVAYPTYDVGARIAGATPIPFEGLTQLGPAGEGHGAPRLVWVNSPSNPTGQVLGVEHLAKVVAWARERGAVVASDECYAQLDWRVDPTGGRVPSILDPAVCGGSHEGLLSVYSMSKQSNLAGYRAAFVAGDPALVGALLEVRKHAGMMVPWPVQRALLAALGDDDHVDAQVEIYRRRRDTLLPALLQAGFRVDHSEAGLYLWSTCDRDSRDTVDALADAGILAAPGDFYGPLGRRHVRVALTATDDAISRAATRLAGLSLHD